MKEQFYRVVSGSFVAGFVTEDGQVVHAAPILGWLKDKPLAAVLTWAKKLGYEVHEIEVKHESKQT